MKRTAVLSLLILIALLTPVKFALHDGGNSRLAPSLADAQAPCTSTTNVGFQLPNAGNTTNWGNCIKYDINKLDIILGGTNPLPALAGQPTISAQSNYTTQNTQATTLTNFIGGYTGQTIRIF